MRLFILLTLYTLHFTLYTSQAQPKREFRGVWIANVGNVDWPSNKGLSPEQQQQELIDLLDLHQKQGLNAVFLQIRNACDAVYPSSIEPWSEWLTGQQGLSPNYDPLALAISECRKRGLEIHAWLNPYRAVTDASKASIATNHVSKLHPDWILPYGTLRILDPGLPEVRGYVLRVVMDVLRRYDVDGVHFDDYFYPYPQTGITLNDNATFARHNRGIANRADWRRDNVNQLVRAVHDSIKAVKPWVKFGISPFGIWQNRSSSPLGSDTKGFEAYSGNFSDALKWLEEDWLDYVAPQVYWSIGNASANFATLVPWWNKNTYGQHVYIGHGTYKINNDSDPNWRNERETPNQIRLIRSHENVQGSVFFSAKILKNNPLGVSDSLRENLYRTPALLPTMAWKDNTPPPPPSQLTAQLTDKSSVELTWNFTEGVSEFDRVRAFVVYRSEKNSRYFRAIVPVLSANSRASFSDQNIQAGVQYTYSVTALDRLHNESKGTDWVAASVLTGIMQEEKPIATAIKTEEPTPNDEVFQVFPNPFNQQISLRYYLSKRTRVVLNVYDERGTRVGALVDEEQNAGPHAVQFNGQFLSEGVYFARLAAGEVQKSIKMVLRE